MVPFPFAMPFVICQGVIQDDEGRPLLRSMKLKTSSGQSCFYIIEICFVNMLIFFNLFFKTRQYILYRVTLEVKALQLELEGLQFKLHWVLEWSSGPDLIVRLLVAFKSILYKCSD